MSTKLPAPPNKIKRKGEPPIKDDVKHNLKKPEPTRIVALNFRVPAEFKKNFKIASATHGITQSELLQQAFNQWHERQG